MPSLGRRMTPNTIKSKTCVRIRKRRLVIVDTLSIPYLGPIPTVQRSFAVFDHDGPAVYSLRRLELVSRCRRRILFLDDHRSVGNRTLWIVSDEPVDDRRRVIDLDGRVNAEADAIYERTGIAEFLVLAPIQRSILPAGEKCF